jgi:hypothetical protein
MNVVIHDAATVKQLIQAEKALWLTDCNGKVLGQFVPRDPVPWEPPITEEELERLKAEDGGRPLSEILADLEKKYGR